MRHISRITLVAVMAVGLGLALGGADAYAASCGTGGPTGGTMWTISNLTSGFWYTVKVTNLSSGGWVYLEIWDDCSQDLFGTWWCSGFVGWSGPWTGWASYTFYASDSTYYAWVETGWNSYQLCVY
jgi:hypothetical protein